MSFLDEMRFDWGFGTPRPSPEYEKMKAEFERYRADIQNSIIMAFNVPQSIQNLHPKKTEKVNWQEEGF